MYPLQITVNVQTPAQLAALNAVLMGDAPAPVAAQEAPKAAPKSETAGTKTPASSDAGKTDPKPDTASAAASTPSSPPADGPSYAETGKYVTKVMQTKGRDVAVGMLKKIKPDAATLKDFDPAQYAEVITAAKAILGEE